MKARQILLCALLTMMLSAVSNNAVAFPEGDPIILTPIDNGGNGNHDGNEDYPQNPKSPTTIIPYVAFDGITSELNFEAVDPVFLTYVITDENNQVVNSQVVNLPTGGSKSFSLASLPTGDYTITLYIGTGAYAGEFSK